MDLADAATSFDDPMALTMRKEYDFSGGKRGAVVPAPTGKQRITIRLDADVLDWFRQQAHRNGGGNYQSLINAALRTHIAGSRELLEATLRRVLREELKARTKATAKPAAGRRQRHGR